MAIRGLLFDFDGLLVDTETPSRLAYEELYREHGHELPLDKWATLVGTIGAPFDPLEHLNGCAPANTSSVTWKTCVRASRTISRKRSADGSRPGSSRAARASGSRGTSSVSAG